jgi:crotonobetainyl-CoA:carnitine CoA-transferase CaiB-like acyl-CoA transferase
MEAVSALTIDALTQYYDSGHRNPTRQSRHPQGQGFVVQTSSNDWMSVHLSSSAKFWAALTLACEMPELQHDARFATYESRGKHYQELAEIVRQVFLTRSTTDWQERLDRLDVPYAPVLTAADYLNHPQVKWLGLIGDEADGVALVGPPWRFDGERPRRDSHVPLVGEDSLDVAREVCEPEQLEDLVRRGVLIQAASTPASSSAEFPGGISCEE